MTTTTKDYYLQLVAQKIWRLSLYKQRSYDNFNDFANLLRSEGKGTFCNSMFLDTLTSDYEKKPLRHYIENLWSLTLVFLESIFLLTC